MAAPVNPTSPQLGVGFYQAAIDAIVIVSNLSIPLSTDSAQTGVISGATAALVVAALEKQRDLY